MRRLLMPVILLVATALVLSCAASHPFERAEPVALAPDEDPWAIVERFRAALPERYSLLNALVFGYNWSNEVAAIGLVKVDVPERRFTAVCMNHMGIKVFEIEWGRAGLERSYALPQLARFKDFGRVVGEDIGRVYFDLLPSARAWVRRGRSEAVFSERAGNGVMLYVFGGRERFLTEKKYYEDDDLKWKVSYYGYRLDGGKAYPGGVVLDNYACGYRLVVRLKEIGEYEQSSD